MLISHSHQFIFFHVAKVAGISIRKALSGYVEEPDFFRIKRPAKFINEKPNPLYMMWQSALLHATVTKTRKELNENIFKQYYKFAFVRNPWDLQVSMYHFILREPEHIYYQLVKDMGSFTKYLEWVVVTKKPFPKGAAKFQKDTLCDNKNKVLVDFVGRYENLQVDFAYICQKLNLQATMPHLNKSQHQNYQSYYNQESQDLVANHFKEDIALFGYEFDCYQNNAEYMQKTNQITSVTDY